MMVVITAITRRTGSAGLAPHSNGGPCASAGPRGSAGSDGGGQQQPRANRRRTSRPRLLAAVHLARRNFLAVLVLVGRHVFAVELGPVHAQGGEVPGQVVLVGVAEALVPRAAVDYLGVARGRAELLGLLGGHVHGDVEGLAAVAHYREPLRSVALLRAAHGLPLRRGSR